MELELEWEERRDGKVSYNKDVIIVWLKNSKELKEDRIIEYKY